MSSVSTPVRDITVAHSPDSDDAFMFYGLASGKVRLPGVRIEHLLEDIQSLNERAMRAEPAPVAYTRSFVVNRIQEGSEPTVTQIRRNLPSFFTLLFLFVSGIAFTPRAAAQQVNPDFYAGMRWRLIGPYRAGRVTAVAEASPLSGPSFSR